MKRLIKKIFENLFYLLFSVSDKEDIIKEIKNYEYISFDIYDTLIKRDTKEPEDLFKLVEEEYNNKHDKKINFVDDRKKAQILAKKDINEEEITLDQIYSKLDKSKYDIDALKKLEIDLEIKYSRKNNVFYDIYNSCVSDNKKVFIVSDMYLPYDVIEKILNENGYTGYQKLYVSSQIMKTKKTGSLFKYILKNDNIDRKKLIHIGDSVINDYLSPKRNRIKSLLIKRKVNNCVFVDDKYNSNLYSIINNNIEKNLSFYQHFGYEIFGPILYGYIRYLHDRIANNDYNCVCFLARDAYIIKEAYEELYGKDDKFKYINISRKSVLLATLELRDFDYLFFQLKSLMKKTATLGDMLSFLDIESKYENCNKLICELSENEKNKMFESISAQLYNKIETQRRLLDLYFIQNNIYGKIAFVDIGWRGTIQYLINKNFKNIAIDGYYIGVNVDKSYKEYNELNRYGYLFNSITFNDFQSVISFSIGLFESMFLRKEGSTLGYDSKDGIVIPIKGKIENFDVNYINQLQSSALDLIKYFKNRNYDSLSIDKETAFWGYKKFCLEAKLSNISKIKEISFTGHRQVRLVECKSFMYYVFHPKMFKIDFNNSYCKIFFLKMVFRIKFPYYYLLNIIYKKSKIER